MWRYQCLSEISDRVKCEYLEAMHNKPEVGDLEVLAITGSAVYFRYTEAKKKRPSGKAKTSTTSKRKHQVLSGSGQASSIGDGNSGVSEEAGSRQSHLPEVPVE